MKGIGPKRQAYLYSVVLEFFLCYSWDTNILDKGYLVSEGIALAELGNTGPFVMVIGARISN